MLGLFFFFKQKTAYEMRISDWSSDVCSSDLGHFGKEVVTCNRTSFGQPVGYALSSGTGGIIERQREREGVCGHGASPGLTPGISARSSAGRLPPLSSDERRVGKECVSTCRFRWSPDLSKTKKNNESQE